MDRCSKGASALCSPACCLGVQFRGCSLNRFCVLEHVLRRVCAGIGLLNTWGGLPGYAPGMIQVRTVQRYYRGEGEKGLVLSYLAQPSDMVFL